MGTITISLGGADPSGRIRPRIEAMLETLKAGGPDTFGLRAGILRVAGRAALDALHAAYIEKSAGGADEWGMTWERLGAKRSHEKQLIGMDAETTILEETGRLMESLNPDGGPDQIFDVDAEAGVVTVGTAVEYAELHQRGFDTGPATSVLFDGTYGKVPARPIVPESGELHPRAEEEMDAKVSEYLVGRLVEMFEGLR